MLSYPFYSGLTDWLDLQAEVKGDILQSVIVSGESSAALQGFGQDIQIGSRERPEVSRPSRPLFRRLSRLG